MSKTIRALTSKKRLNKQAPYGAASHTVNQDQGFDQIAFTEVHPSGETRSPADNSQLANGLKTLVHALARKAARDYLATNLDHPT